jgi:hypothetical protein
MDFSIEDPLPGKAELKDAEGLLARVVRDSVVAALVARRTSLNPVTDTLQVWVSWMTKESLIILGTPVMRLMNRCSQCVSRTFYGVEGGQAYTSGVPHLSIALHDKGPYALQFCVRFVDRGVNLPLNSCAFPESATLQFLRAKTSWIPARFD